MGYESFFRVFYQNLLMQLRQIRRNIMLILVPIIIFFFIYLFFSVHEVSNEFISPIRVGIIDEDNTVYSLMLVQSFKDNEQFSQFVNIWLGEAKEVNEAFEHREIDALIVVPKGFVESVVRFEEMPLQVTINYDDPVKAILLKNVIDSYEKFIRSVDMGVSFLNDQMIDLEFEQSLRYSYYDRAVVRLVFAALGRNDYFDYKKIINVPTVVAVKYYFIAIVVMFLMYLSIFSAINLIREKQNMCLRRLQISRISMFSYLMAKALATTVYISMIVIIWYTLYYLFYGRLSDGLGIHLISFMVVCIFFDVSLSLFFTLFFEEEEPVVLLSSVFVFLNAVVGGSIIPIHNMSHIIQKMAVVTPNYWMIKGFLFLDHHYNVEHIFWVGLIMLSVSLVFILLVSWRYTRRVA